MTDQLGLGSFADAVAAPRRPLPAPVKPRFQPLRAGILNVWQYDDQELTFHDGRLILRGENGTGKSKALEVLLPFLLDADLSPYRLDPFQGQGRSMRWNLLEGGRHESRLGYVWLELGRRRDPDEVGGAQYVTLGCGLRASKRTKGVDAWYFVAEGKRMGESLSLATAARQPLSRNQLKLELDQAGTVFQNAGEYRREVDRLLYRLDTDRFAALRHLLLQLRRPQLSEKLDPDKLSDLLGKSLPPIDEDLIGELAELFERLAHHEKELHRLRAATAAVEAFLTVYREYCRGVARARADEVSRGDSRYRKKSEELRAADEASQAVETELASLGERSREAREHLDRLHGEIRALEQSEAMKAAQALAAREAHTRTLEEQAERDREDRYRLERDVESRDRDHAATREAKARHQERLAEPARRAAEGASRAGLEAVHAAAEAKLAEDAVAHDDDARGTVRAAVRQRREAVDELRGLKAERDRAEEGFRRAEGRRHEADEQVRAAHERERDALAAVAAEVERLDAALVDWAAACEELRLGNDELDVLREALLPEDERRTDLTSALAERAAERRDRIVEERTALRDRIVELREERAATAGERRRVAETRELGPEPPRTRAAEREGRPGTPFYLLCDFAAEVPESGRAGLEAALEGAGLLDAWVTPDGRLLDPETLDTVLVPRSRNIRQDLGTLDDVLVPAGGSGAVPEDVVRRLLASVALGETAGDEAEAAVGTDGSWRLGPLHGRWTKPAPEHLGAAAREAARRRRLAELDARLAELDLRLAEAEAEEERLERRLERLASEAREAPSAAELERRRHQAKAAADDLARRRAELTEAESAVAAARRERDEARQRLEARAADLGLAARLGDLEAYRDQVRDYQALFDDLARAWLAARHAALAEERARDLAAETRARHDEAARRAAQSLSGARSARAEVEALRATVGVEAREVVERHTLAVRRRDELTAALDELQAAVGEARERFAVIQERRRHLGAELEELDQERRRASNRLDRLVELGFLGLVVTAELPEGSWSLTRALETARAIGKETADVDLSPAATDRRTNNLMPRYRELEGEIGGDFQSRLDQEDDLLVFRMTHQQRDHDGPEFLAALAAEVAERESELAEEERELMRRILLGDVGNHLRGRLRQAGELIQRMNRLLVDCPTASGMKLRLSWRADEDADPRVREVLELLRRDPELLGDADRQVLEGFFQARIDEAREQQALVPWREHLLEALDYRRWHRFRIERRQPGDATWNVLTQRAHAASSGGEKAVALHLPLFAAAAAHYASAREEAPRLILLDEAFAGIDQGMRGRCMALLVEFDLDFMMTSYDEWGCYEELPGVATYQLYRDPAAGGVAAIRFVWNGERLVEEE